MFKVSGIWVSPFEVESALVAHDAVLEAAVVPAPDEDGLLKPKAFVVLKDRATVEGLADALKQQVKETAGPWKYPRWVVFVEDLPKTATGKVQRYKLLHRKATTRSAATVRKMATRESLDTCGEYLTRAVGIQG